MRRIGFRRLLPLAFTVVHLAIVLLATKQRWSIAVIDARSTYHTVAVQENTSVPFEPLQPRPLSVAEKTTLCLNLPALLLVVPIAVIFLHGTDSGLLASATPFVPLLWYWIGKWADVQLGFVERLPKPRSWVRELGRTLLSVVTALGFLVFLLSVTPLNHHRSGDTYWMGAAGVFWSGLLFAINTYGRRCNAVETNSGPNSL